MARPKINPEKHRKNVAMTLDPDLLLQARALAAKKGRSLSQLVEQLLNKWIATLDLTADEIHAAVAGFVNQSTTVSSQRAVEIARKALANTKEYEAQRKGTETKRRTKALV